MSAQHTPGPLYVGEINHRKQRADIDTATKDERVGYSTWRGLARTYGCEDFPSIGSEIMEANARRIVACWNACLSISTEALEQGVLPEMMKALKACNEAMPYMSEYGIPIALPEQVKAVIAKAEGGAA